MQLCMFQANLNRQKKAGEMQLESAADDKEQVHKKRPGLSCGHTIQDDPKRKGNGNTVRK